MASSRRLRVGEVPAAQPGPASPSWTGATGATAAGSPTPMSAAAAGAPAALLGQSPRSVLSAAVSQGTRPRSVDAAGSATEPRGGFHAAQPTILSAGASPRFSAGSLVGGGGAFGGGPVAASPGLPPSSPSRLGEQQQPQQQLQPAFQAHSFGPGPPPSTRVWTPPRSAGRLRPEDALQQELRELGGTESFEAGTVIVSTQHGRPQSGSSGSGKSGSAAGLAPASNGGGGAAAGDDASPRHPPIVWNNLLAEGGAAAAAAGGAGRPGSAGGAGAMSKLRERLAGVAAAAAPSSHGSAASLTSIEAFVASGDAASDECGCRSPGSGAVLAARLATAGSGTSGSSRPGSGGGALSGSVPRGATPLLGRQLAGPSAAQWVAEAERLIGSGCRERAVLMPGPTGSTVKCYVRRTRNLLGSNTTYEMRIESTDRLLLSARRRAKNKCPTYLIALSEAAAGEVTPESSDAIAKLKANLVGSEYTAWLKRGPADVRKGFGAQALSVRYHPASSAASAGARGMAAILPAPGEPLWLPEGGNSDAPGALGPLLSRAEARELAPSMERRVVLLRSMTPFYDEAKGVHYLDFRGRVTRRSTKNFQLVHWDHNAGALGGDLTMQFGKRSGDEFALDFAAPLSALQAFALALSSFDSKILYAV